MQLYKFVYRGCFVADVSFTVMFYITIVGPNFRIMLMNQKVIGGFFSTRISMKESSLMVLANINFHFVFGLSAGVLL